MRAGGKQAPSSSSNETKPIVGNGNMGRACFAVSHGPTSSAEHAPLGRVVSASSRFRIVIHSHMAAHCHFPVAAWPACACTCEVRCPPLAFHISPQCMGNDERMTVNGKGGGPAHARLTYGRSACSGHCQDTQTRAQRLMMQVFGPSSAFLVFLQPEGFAKHNRKHPTPLRHTSGVQLRLAGFRLRPSSKLSLYPNWQFPDAALVFLGLRNFLVGLAHALCMSHVVFSRIGVTFAHYPHTHTPHSRAPNGQTPPTTFPPSCNSTRPPRAPPF